MTRRGAPRTTAQQGGVTLTPKVVSLLIHIAMQGSHPAMMTTIDLLKLKVQFSQDFCTRFAAQRTLDMSDFFKHASAVIAMLGMQGALLGFKFTI